MKNKYSSINGFVPRRSGERIGDLHKSDSDKSSFGVPENRLLHTTGSDTNRLIGKPMPGDGLGRSDIEESLREIDEDKGSIKKLSFLQKRRLKKQIKRPKSLISRIIKWIVIVIILAGVSLGGYAAYKIISVGGNILQGSILDIFRGTPLKEDANGRSNFLILGTSEDDAGHPGSSLTDSIMVVSVDQDNKNVYMFSVPRDLYVDYGGPCNSGYYGKINEYFSCSNGGNSSEDEQDRLAKTQKFVGNIFGIDIQYGVHVNHTVIKEAVDAVGGIDVDIQGSNGAPGILDRNFDWRCDYTCYLVKYDNGVHHLDGERALYLSQARGDVSPTYGLGNSNFDREKNQQKIIIALKDKAMSTGTLTNLGAITQLIDALGNNLRTNIKMDEVNTLMQIASNTKTEDIYSLSLVDEGLVSTGMFGGASVVMPRAGVYNYSAIRSFIDKNLNSDPVVREAAAIVVLNGTNQTGLGRNEADKLIDSNLNVVMVDNAPSGTYEKVEIYQVGDGKSQTANKLASLYQVEIKKTEPPIEVGKDVNFVIIIGLSTS